MPISTKNNSSLLIVASSQNTTNSIKQVMGGLFGKVAVADTMVLAKQKLAAEHYDSLIINAPLTDDNGIQAALDIAARLPIGILLLVSGEIFDKVAYRAKNTGIFVISRPVKGQQLIEAAGILITMQRRLDQMALENQKLRRRLDDMEIITRAKCLLIERQHLSEEQAHYYVEKYAMDGSVTKREAAMEIIARLDEL